MTIAEGRNAFSIPHNIKQVAPPKTQSNTRNNDKYCTNCGMNNHNVETCKKEKKETTVTTIEVAQLSQKPHKTSSYTCHICGLNGHKMTNCPKFTKMQRCFMGNM
jgi:hypothetical protein